MRHSPTALSRLAAGWERLCRTLPDEEEDQAITPHPQAISRSGLLEGRIQFPIPEAWEGESQGRPRHTVKGNFAFHVQSKHQPFPGHGFLKRVGQHWIVIRDGEFIKLPAGLDAGPVDYAAVEVNGDRTFIRACYSWPPSPYKLYAIDRGNGRIIWSTTVWAAGNWLSYSGSGWHFVGYCAPRIRVSLSSAWILAPFTLKFSTRRPGRTYADSAV